MNKDSAPFNDEIRRYIRAWFKVTHLKSSVLGYNKWTVNWWKGTEKGHDSSDPRGNQPKTIPQKVLDFMHSYIKDENIRRHVNINYYQRGFRYYPLNDGNRQHAKDYLYFLRRFHPEETGQIKGIEQKLYAPSPKAVALKEEDRTQRPEKSKNTLVKITKKGLTPEENLKVENFLDQCEAREKSRQKRQEEGSPEVLELYSAEQEMSKEKIKEDKHPPKRAANGIGVLRSDGIIEGPTRVRISLNDNVVKQCLTSHGTFPEEDDRE